MSDQNPQNNPWAPNSGQPAGQDPQHQPSANPAPQSTPWGQPQNPQAPQGGPVNPYPPQQPQHWGGSSSHESLGAETKGLFGSLFDFSFRHFATPKIVRITYILCTVMMALVALGMVAGAFGMMAQDEAGAGFLMLLLTPIVILFYLALIRMSMEMYVALTRLAEDVGHLREELKRR
ncbi:DUF4282 domain-containing protein [Luteococcus sp. OSA5]|uniref:DUF4282 domain-containing protein n=1 Tax=Luteococcus sp. OSA5 TaxID=3401630 RepID=UPI003B43800D